MPKKDYETIDIVKQLDVLADLYSVSFDIKPKLTAEELEHKHKLEVEALRNERVKISTGHRIDLENLKAKNAENENKFLLEVEQLKTKQAETELKLKSDLETLKNNATAAEKAHELEVEKFRSKIKIDQERFNHYKKIEYFACILVGALTTFSIIFSITASDDEMKKLGIGMVGSIITGVVGFIIGRSTSTGEKPSGDASKGQSS